jgi:hypothetical protein
LGCGNSRLSNLNDWDKLKQGIRGTWLSFVEIRQGLVSGYKVQFPSGALRIRRLIVANTVLKGAPTMVRNAREHSIGVRGARIFNLQPEAIRTTNTEHVDLFKNHLEILLSSIPD